MHRSSRPHVPPAPTTRPSAVDIEAQLWSTFDMVLDWRHAVPPELRSRHRHDLEPALAAAQALVELLAEMEGDDVQGPRPCRRLEDLGPDDPWGAYLAADRCGGR